MPLKVYIAPQIGTGTMVDPFRSKINEYIDPSIDEFDEIDNPSGRRSLVFLRARQAVHDAIALDADITALSLVFNNTQRSELLNTTFGSLPAGVRDKIQTEVSRHTTFTIPDTATVRQILRQVIYRFLNHQRVQGGLPEENWASKSIYFGGGIL